MPSEPTALRRRTLLSMDRLPNKHNHRLLSNIHNVLHCTLYCTSMTENLSSALEVDTLSCRWCLGVSPRSILSTSLRLASGMITTTFHPSTRREVQGDRRYSGAPTAACTCALTAPAQSCLITSGWCRCNTEL